MKLQVAAAVEDHLVPRPNSGHRVVHAALVEVGPVLIRCEVDELVVARDAVTVVGELDGQAGAQYIAAAGGNRNERAFAEGGVIGEHADGNRVCFPVEDETAGGAEDPGVVGGEGIQGGRGEAGVRIKKQYLLAKIITREDGGGASVVVGLHEEEEGIRGDHVPDGLGNELETEEVLGREVGENLCQCIVVEGLPVDGGGSGNVASEVGH